MKIVLHTHITPSWRYTQMSGINRITELMQDAVARLNTDVEQITVEFTTMDELDSAHEKLKAAVLEGQPKPQGKDRIIALATEFLWWNIHHQEHEMNGEEPCTLSCLALVMTSKELQSAGYTQCKLECLGDYGVRLSIR